MIDSANKDPSQSHPIARVVGFSAPSSPAEMSHAVCTHPLLCIITVHS